MSFSVSVRLTLLALASLAATGASAQIKTDGLWRGVGGAALAMTSGNSNSTALSINGDMVRATTADKMSFGANTNYARSKVAGVTSTTANKWSGFGQYDYNLSPSLFAFGKLGLEGDELTDLALRSSLAAGLGYKLIDTKETSFNVFGGAAYTVDQYDSAQTIGSKTAKSFSRASIYLGEESSHTLSASTTTLALRLPARYKPISPNRVRARPSWASSRSGSRLRTRANASCASSRWISSRQA